MQHTDYLRQLDRKGVNLHINDAGQLAAGPPSALMPADRAYIAANKDALLADLVERNDKLTVAYETIGKASQWESLETIIARGLEAWSDGVISTVDYEAMATACIEQARSIPCSWTGDVPDDMRVMPAEITKAQKVSLAFDGAVDMTVARRAIAPTA